MLHPLFYVPNLTAVSHQCTRFRLLRGNARVDEAPWGTARGKLHTPCHSVGRRIIHSVYILTSVAC
eukprot:6150199-Pyramimonas_sp.AAC.1